jgi:hypothetical protein
VVAGRDVDRISSSRRVLPRELLAEQIDAFGKYLSAHTQPQEVRIRYVSGDAESQRYAASDFATAFRKGNWLPTLSAIDPLAITCNQAEPNGSHHFSCSSELQGFINHLEGASITQTGPNLPQTTLEEKLHATWLYATITQAVNEAGIHGVEVGYNNNTDPLNTVTVFVGLRPRDKWGILPPNFGQRLQQRMPNDLTDDDF